MTRRGAAAAMLGAALAAGAAGAAGAGPPGGEDVLVRGGVANARIRFETARTGHVALLGGSITEMDGYRPMVAEMLRKRFPETAFEFTSAGIASTCSTTGAFRLADDVLAKGPADLLFVEFAVNDDQDAHHTREECVRGMEGIVRHLRRHNPRADVVFVYFVNESMMETYRKRETPLPVAAHEAVAERYGVPSLHLARAVTRRIDAGEFTWKDYGGVHPAPFGNRLAADLVGALLDACWKGPLEPGAAAREHPLPAALDPQNYEGGRFLAVREARLGEGWRIGVPDWAALAGGKRDRFTRLDILEATRPGARLTLEFRGSCVGAYVLAGPDAGIVEASVDGGAARRVDLWHPFSAGLHYPRTVLLADGLAPGRHTLVLTVAAERNAQSQGTAARIMHFAANDGADAGPRR